MNRSDLHKNKFLVRLNRGMKRRLGESIYMIISIMSLLLVFSGLVVGLLGRGWLGAWFLVMLGLGLGFLPVLSFVMSEKTENVKKDEETAGKNAGERKRPASGSEEEKRQAIEFEAMLARARLKREEENRRHIEETREKILEDYRLRMAAKQLRLQEEKRREEEKKAAQEKEKQERKRLEEERARQETYRDRRENAGRDAGKYRNSGGNVYKREDREKKQQFFSGVKDSGELKKRYKELMKKYHPDNGDGRENTEVLTRIHEEYKELERFFKSYEKHKK